jgi:hypothetical protein
MKLLLLQRIQEDGEKQQNRRKQNNRKFLIENQPTTLRSL